MDETDRDRVRPPPALDRLTHNGLVGDGIGGVPHLGPGARAAI